MQEHLITNNLTIDPNGSNKLKVVLEMQFLATQKDNSITLVYVDATKGWVVVNDAIYKV